MSFFGGVLLARCFALHALDNSHEQFIAIRLSLLYFHQFLSVLAPPFIFFGLSLVQGPNMPTRLEFQSCSSHLVKPAEFSPAYSFVQHFNKKDILTMHFSS